MLTTLGRKRLQENLTFQQYKAKKKWPVNFSPFHEEKNASFTLLMKMISNLFSYNILFSFENQIAMRKRLILIDSFQLYVSHQHASYVQNGMILTKIHFWSWRWYIIICVYNIYRHELIRLNILLVKIVLQWNKIYLATPFKPLSQQLQ